MTVGDHGARIAADRNGDDPGDARCPLRTCANDPRQKAECTVFEYQFEQTAQRGIRLELLRRFQQLDHRAARVRYTVELEVEINAKMGREHVRNSDNNAERVCRYENKK